MSPTDVDMVSPSAPSALYFLILTPPTVKFLSTNVLPPVLLTLNENDEETIGSTMDISNGEVL